MGERMSSMNGLDDAIVHVATSLPSFKTVGPNSVVDTGVTVNGFLILEAVNMDAAIAIAQSDPFATHAAIGVSEMMVMGG
ncbi:MAG: hypothetical protein ACI9EH_000453 [Planktomarina sp.]|jgi:uncharacterized protein YciI|tara:strand:- start:366 stop:605 length:240 start_codon:yes stop_codon:yes gene_type:complete